LTSRGWVDPVPDPLLLRKSGSARDRTRDLCICSQKLWPLDHFMKIPPLGAEIFHADGQERTWQFRERASKGVSRSPCIMLLWITSPRFNQLHNLRLLINCLVFMRGNGKVAGPSGCAVYGVGLRPLACWDCGVESHRGHGCQLWVLCVVR